MTLKVEQRRKAIEIEAALYDSGYNLSDLYLLDDMPEGHVMSLKKWIRKFVTDAELRSQLDFYGGSNISFADFFYHLELVKPTKLVEEGCVYVDGKGYRMVNFETQPIERMQVLDIYV
jgi:hypothetical protein